MFERLKRDFEALRRDPPGQRFALHHRRHAERGEEFWKSTLFLVLGVILFFGGVIISLPPGIPGFFLYIPGLILIVSRLAFVARLVDRIDLRLHQFLEKRRKRRQDKKTRGPSQTLPRDG